MSRTVDHTVKDIDKAGGNSTGRCQGAELVQTGDGQWAAPNVVFGAYDVPGHERAPAPDVLHQGVGALGAAGYLVELGYIRRYRDWSNANRPKATNPSATAVSRNLPNGCARVVCSAPSSPCACCRSKVSAA
jgi:hypothetical protein